MIALLGGSFDPIHNAHLHCAKFAQHYLACQAIYLLPNYQSPLKQHSNVSNKHRLAMLKLVCATNTDLHILDYEINRPELSYSLHTLKYLRQLYGVDETLVFIIGSDAFQAINTWYRYQELFALCHFLIIKRPGTTRLNLPPDLQQRLNTDPSSLKLSPHGQIALINNPLLDISSTQIRQKLSAHESVDVLMPNEVLNYIKHHSLYT